MKKFTFKIIIVFTLLISYSGFSQEFYGKATYQTKTAIDIDFSATGMPASRIKMIKERMKKNFEKTFILNFSKNTSIYKEEASLGSSGGGGRGMRIMGLGSSNSGKFYKNIQTKKMINEKEFSGKFFLIKDDLKTYDWKMEQETKMIGQYLCFKATTVIEVPKRKEFKFERRNKDKDSSDEEKSDDKENKDAENKDKKSEDAENKDEKNEEAETEFQIVTAWHTLDIPVSNGPSNYGGLPGLILEVGYGKTNILCTKIVINPKEKSKIEEPKKGKVVSQEEYEKIVETKMKEMQERMQNERQKDGHNTHTIRIGG